MGFLDRPQAVAARRVCVQIHLWIGIAAGLYVVAVCLSGAALVFRIDLQRALHPRLFTPRTAGPVAHAADIMDRVARAYPDATISGVDAPTTARPTYLAYASRGRAFLTLLLDPASGELLGELPADSFVRTLQDLHFDLLAGRTGRIVNGIGGLLLLAMCLTGLVIWWPGRSHWRRGFVVDVSRQWKRITWDLHSAAGIWTFAFVAMWGVTGAYFAFPAAFRATVDVFSPLTVARAPQSGRPLAEGQRAPAPRDLIDEASRYAPGLHVARVVTPSSSTAAFLVLFAAAAPTPLGGDPLTPVYLDQYSGALLAAPAPARSAGDAVIAWMAPLHVGSFGGWPVKVAWLVIGLTPPLLFVTGFLMWWVRVVRPQWVRLARPAEEAAR